MKKGGVRMKRWVWMAMVPGFLGAGVTQWGQEGVIRVQSAEISAKGQLTLLLPGLHVWYRGIKATDGTDVPTLAANAHFGVGYALTPNAALSVTGQFLADYEKDRDKNTRYAYGFGDTRLDLKAAFPLPESPWRLGVGVLAYFPTGQKDDPTAQPDTTTSGLQYPSGFLRSFTGVDFQLGVQGLATYRAKNGWGLHLNIGGFSPTADTLPAMVFGGFALDVSPSIFSPLLEVWTLQYANKDFRTQYGNGPTWASLGFRLGQRQGANLQVSASMPIFSRNQPAQRGILPGFRPDVVADVAAYVLLTPPQKKAPEKPKPAYVAGVVQDDKGLPLGDVNLRLYRGDSLLGQATSTEAGAFEMVADAGVYTLNVEHPDYLPMSKPIVLKPGDTLSLTLSLKPKAKPAPKPKEGTLTLRVVDVEKGTPIENATLTLEGKEPLQGSSASFRLSPGTYKVTISAPGYISTTKTYTVEADKTVEAEVALVRKKLQVRLPKVHFDVGKATIRPESYPILDRAAQLIKRILEDNPSVRIEIQGHTDSQGSFPFNMRLSQARAEAVKEYLVTTHQIPEERLIAKGYGPTKPFADNSTPFGREQNRRVELVVLEPSE